MPTRQQPEMAPMGAEVNSAGNAAWLWITDHPCQHRYLLLCAVAPSINISAAAPSEMELELAAVMVPSLPNAGLSVRSSGLPLPGCSSSSPATSDHDRYLPARMQTRLLAVHRARCNTARANSSMAVGQTGLIALRWHVSPSAGHHRHLANHRGRGDPAPFDAPSESRCGHYPADRGARLMLSIPPPPPPC